MSERIAGPDEYWAWLGRTIGVTKARDDSVLEG
jgi:hypothetical protein